MSGIDPNLRLGSPHECGLGPVADACGGAEIMQTVRKLAVNFEIGSNSSLRALRATIFGSLTAEKPRYR
jgi:hypothetical protein